MQQKYGDIIVLLFPVEIFPESLGVLEHLSCQANLSQLTFYFPRNHQKIYDILLMSG